MGFQPIEWELAKDKNRPGGVKFKTGVDGISITPLPANPDALVQAKAAGIDIARLGLSARAPASAAAYQQDLDKMPKPIAAKNSFIDPDLEERRHAAQTRAVAQGRLSTFESFGKIPSIGRK